MSVIEEVHQNDIGTQILVSVYDDTSPVDLSGASTIEMIFKKPDGNVLTKTAVLYGDGTDGVIVYTTVEGDLNVAGKWAIQVYVVIGSSSWKTNIAMFRVYENIS